MFCDEVIVVHVVGTDWRGESLQSFAFGSGANPVALSEILFDEDDEEEDDEEEDEDEDDDDDDDDDEEDDVDDEEDTDEEDGTHVDHRGKSHVGDAVVRPREWLEGTTRKIRLTYKAPSSTSQNVYLE